MSDMQPSRSTLRCLLPDSSSLVKLPSSSFDTQPFICPWVSHELLFFCPISKFPP
ncbi:unnamed protein product [Spirodela intermedia]|uniref:Uncharacterized protein n=1 Tax=Spirodela intermedia TaxID=51605 RepID=A0A7I8K253_SPIIN|nr:unnamed protein product [Spirodela intermedia]